MFADACNKAMKYTRPVAVSTRQHDGSMRTDVATMVVINSDGWAITAGHVFDSFVKFQQDMKKTKEIEDLNKTKVHHPNAPSVPVQIDKGFITNHSFWWGWDGVRLNNVLVNRQVDVAIGKLEPFDPKWVTEYPVFADPNHMRIGTSVCRGGFPFINIKPEFLEDKKAFRIPKIQADKFFYPIEGIYTHFEERGKSADGSCTLRYVETSSAGLKGQSGGPIFDRFGHIYGLQVFTDHRNTGFHPTAELDGQKMVENQFINIGVGVHVSTLYELFKNRNIRYDMEGDESGFRIVD
jgi:hypothetical protein